MIRHEKQIAAFADPSRHKYLLAGRRGGKTSGIREDILKKVTTCPPGGEIFYIAPTNAHAYELMWENLEMRMEDLGWPYKAQGYRNRFLLPENRKIYIIGAEKIRRIRGHKVYHAYLDELAFFETALADIWKAVRPALSDLKGGCTAATTPDGKGSEAYDFYIACMKKHNWKNFHWYAIDNPGIDPDEIEEAKREMDERAFRQEYMASWETFEGLAYYNFDENVHIEKCSEFKSTGEIDIAMDFNVNPTSLLVAQDIRDHYFIRKEYSFKNSSTPETVEAFCRDFEPYKDKVRVNIFGDSTGNNRSSVGGTDYFYTKEILAKNGFQFEMHVPSKNPKPIDRVNHVNGALKNVYGKSKVTIDPDCADLIRDLSSQELVGRLPSPKNNLGHKGDAFGYYITRKSKDKMIGQSRTIQL